MKKPSVQQGAAPDFSFGVRELLARRDKDARRIPPMAEWTIVEDAPDKLRRKAAGFDPYNSLGNPGAAKRSAWRFLLRR